MSEIVMKPIGYVHNDVALNFGEYPEIKRSYYLPTSWHYIDAQELIQKVRDMYPEQEKFIDANAEILSKYFSKKIEEEGEIVVQIKSLFWKCRL